MDLVQLINRTDTQGRVQLMVPLPSGEQTLVVTPVDRAAYKESRYLITVSAGTPAEYNLVVSPDSPLDFDHGREMPTLASDRRNRRLYVTWLPDLRTILVTEAPIGAVGADHG